MSEAFEGKTAVILTATYNDWPSLAHLLPEIDKALSPMGVKGRVVVVDDGSFDHTGKKDLGGLSFSAIETVEEVVLSSNQGNQRALAIGVAHVAEHFPCDYLVVMDSDNEDKPEYIPDLLKACEEAKGEKIIFAERTKRSEGLGFRVFYSLYQGLYRLFTGQKIDVGNFSVVPGKLVRRLAHIGELWNHFPAGIMRARIPYDKIPAERGVRRHGGSSMNLVRLVVHAFSGFTVHADVVAARTLLVSLVFAVAISFWAGSYIWVKLFTDIPLLGWTSLMVAEIIVMGIQIMSAAVIILFLVLSRRLQVPMIPALDYRKFIFEVNRLYPSR